METKIKTVAEYEAIFAPDVLQKLIETEYTVDTINDAILYQVQDHITDEDSVRWSNFGYGDELDIHDSPYSENASNIIHAILNLYGKHLMLETHMNWNKPEYVYFL